MAFTFSCNGGAVSNPVGDGHAYPCFLYNRDNKIVCSLTPNDIKWGQSFAATFLSVHLGGSAREYTFAQNITIHPGDTLVLSLGSAGTKTATIFIANTASYTVNLIPGPSANALLDHATLTAHHDIYMQKVLAFAKVHALMGSSRTDFNAALANSGIKDDTELKKLTKDQFKAVNNANATVRLEGDKTEDADQRCYDETAMLACYVNTRLNAVANAQHPEAYDISKTDQQLAVINASANGLFNWYNSHMGKFVTSVSISSETINHSYSTVDVKLEAIKDIFESLALPDAALKSLLGAVSSFISDVQNLAAAADKKDLRNAKLINFYSVQPPLGNKNLKHNAKMRMVYVQFNETSLKWSSNCASGTKYNLSVTVFTLDVDMNREVVSLVYDHCKERILQAAEIDLDDIGSSGSPPTTDPIKVPGPNPIGPAPIPSRV